MSTIHEASSIGGVCLWDLRVTQSVLVDALQLQRQDDATFGVCDLCKDRVWLARRENERVLEAWVKQGFRCAGGGDCKRCKLGGPPLCGVQTTSPSDADGNREGAAARSASALDNTQPE